MARQPVPACLGCGTGGAAALTRKKLRMWILLGGWVRAASGLAWAEVMQEGRESDLLPAATSGTQLQE